MGSAVAALTDSSMASGWIGVTALALVAIVGIVHLWRTNARIARRTAVLETELLERRRIAVTLHDHLQQLLVAAKYGIHQAASEPMSPKLASSMQQLDALLGEAIASSRDLAVQLAPPILYERGLLAGLEWLARQFEEKHRLKVTLITRRR